jgi:hypothetical protein
MGQGTGNLVRSFGGQPESGGGNLTGRKLMLRAKTSLGVGASAIFSLAGLLFLAEDSGASARENVRETARQDVHETAQGSDCEVGPETFTRPDHLYGARLGFDVLRNGDRVGTHDTYFDVDGGRVTVQSETRIRVKVLFVTAYSFNYESQSVWCNGTLTGFSAERSDNGKKRIIRAVRDGQQYEISARWGETRVDGPLHVNEHWNREVLQDGRVINAVNGKLVTVSVTDLGDDIVEVRGGKLPARHYRYSGELETDVWYDRMGRWVKMRFVTKKDQSVIEYYCTTCIPAPSARAD